jgi:predicted phosphodiesterase
VRCGFDSEGVPRQRRVAGRALLLSSLVPAALGISCRARNPDSNVESSKAAPTSNATQYRHAGSRDQLNQIPPDNGTSANVLLDGGRPLVRVALLGDQGLGSRSRAVLDLVRDAGADFVVILGDFDYLDRPAAWRTQLDRLGSVPWFAVVGNHDLAKWPEYQRLIMEERGRIRGARCNGVSGSREVCRYRGVTLVLSGIGTLGTLTDDEVFIESALRGDTGNWKLCLWHKTQHDMQLGMKKDEVGWSAYKTCQAAGAIVVTGHEHSYSRSRTLTAVGEVARGHGATGELNKMVVGPGKTFVAVSGLGGVETRPFVASHATDTWWSAFLTANRQSVGGKITQDNHQADGVGALFLDFGVEGDAKRGRGRFVTAFDRRVFDDFSIRFE